MSRLYARAYHACVSPRLAGNIAVLGFLLLCWFSEPPHKDRSSAPERDATRSAPPPAADAVVPGSGYIPAGAPMQPPPAPPPRKGARSIDFDLLSYFDYDPEADLIPDDVLALDGKIVELRGVMYYAVDDPDNVNEFFLMPNHTVCCFGVPRTNEAVHVVLKRGATTQYVLNYYLVRGRLAVGAVRGEDDRVHYLYLIRDAEAEVME